MGDVTLSLNQKIETDVTDEIETVDNEVVDENQQESETLYSVIILETPTGFLNVRSGPSTSYSKISEVFTDDEFVVLKEDNNWVKIMVSEDLQGWITLKYADKK